MKNFTENEMPKHDESLTEWFECHINWITRNCKWRFEKRGRTVDYFDKTKF